ncbi:hypothetical protein GCM10010869_49470 [Mesorhizobium tianshanense]|nr:hypothetical protein GCM10010869_49470 [Mesorhizobium tianshanense]
MITVVSGWVGATRSIYFLAGLNDEFQILRGSRTPLKTPSGLGSSPLAPCESACKIGSDALLVMIEPNQRR